MTVPCIHRSREAACGGPESRRTGGFTLIESVVVLGLIAIVTAAGIPMYRSAVAESQTITAIADIREIASAIQRYLIQYDVFPLTLDDVGQGGRVDPWGNPYVFLNFDTIPGGGNGPKRKDKNIVPINSYFDLYSEGPDGQSVSPLTANPSLDDVIYGRDGEFIGKATDY